MNSLQGDVWKLETDSEEVASDDLADLIRHCIDQEKEVGDLIPYLRSLWDNESWESIRHKFNSEGSTWYVWWMDGVRAHKQKAA